jgi:hypothetical protein
MSRGLIACQSSGRRRVPSAINAEVERLYGPYATLDPLAHVTGLRPCDSTAAVGLRLSRKSPSRGGHVSAPDPYSCRGLPGLGALPGPGPYPEGPGTYPRDPICPLGSPGPISTEVRRPSAEVRTYRCTLGSFIFPCHAVLPTPPMWWGQVLLLVRPGGVARQRHLYTIGRGYP